MVRERGIPRFTGLSGAEAAARLKEGGYNELPSSKPRSIVSIACDVGREPMFILLVVCGAIYLVLGDLQEALMLLGFVLFMAGITLFQEQKTERALEALRDLSSPRALVIRDSEQKRIAGRNVVRGDVLILTEGDRVPADAVLMRCVSLLVDESLLTGESVPVRKIARDGILEMNRPGGDDLPFVYSGTLVVQGQGIAHVLATGVHTEIGKVGKALQRVRPETTLLQREIGRMVRNVAILGLSLSTLVVIAFGLTRGNWLDGLLAGVTVAMATLPNEIPVVLTIFLALGAWRISQHQVLTRRVPAVETLGSATVLCVDKTGTLTLNRMSVTKLYAHSEWYDVAEHEQESLPETFHELIEFSLLASQRISWDPMEKALTQLGDRCLAKTEHLHGDWTLVHEYPLSRDLLALSHVWRSPQGNDLVIAAKGAPEALADLCHLNEEQIKALAEYVHAMASEGLRVLGVAKAAFKQPPLPGKQHDFEFEFLGLIGFADPVRPGVSATLKECYTAGIRVVMITGDYPDTAQSIARQIGLTPADECLTGPVLAGMDDSELQHHIKTVNIFARVMPEQKLRLVNALKANREIVAMTGDGVNDAPAMKAAHIGIAMGERGTDVAREASALVLLADDFSSIVQAVKLGRQIFDNLKKAMAYLLAIHVPIAGMSLIPVLLKWPLVLLPVHIAFLHLIIDPACSIVFEREPAETDVMIRPPRKPHELLFRGHMLGLSLLQGMGVLLILLAVFSVALYRGQGELDARALTFTTLIIANLGLIVTNRSWSHTMWGTFRSPNAALRWVIGGALVFLATILYVPLLRDLFRFSRLHLIDLAICFTAGMVSIVWFEGLKMLRRRALVGQQLG